MVIRLLWLHMLSYGPSSKASLDLLDERLRFF